MQRGVHTLQLVTPCYFSLHPFRRGVGNPSLPLLTHPHPWTPPTPTAALSYSPRLYAVTPLGALRCWCSFKDMPGGREPPLPDCLPSLLSTSWEWKTQESNSRWSWHPEPRSHLHTRGGGEGVSGSPLSTPHFFPITEVTGQHRKVKVWVSVVSDPIGCSPPGSSVHGILQARILEWVAVPFSRGSSEPRDGTQVSRTAGELFTIWPTRVLLKKRNAQVRNKTHNRGFHHSICFPLLTLFSCKARAQTKHTALFSLFISDTSDHFLIPLRLSWKHV